MAANGKIICLRGATLPGKWPWRQAGEPGRRSFDTAAGGRILRNKSFSAGRSGQFAASRMSDQLIDSGRDPRSNPANSGARRRPDD